MNKEHKLIRVKLLHTLIWVFFNVVLGYLFYAVISNNLNIWFWIGIGLVLFEGLILIMFNYSCPLTIIAKKYSNSTKDNFDIYLPNWLAKYTKLIYTSFFLVILIILLFQLFLK